MSYILFLSLIILYAITLLLCAAIYKLIFKLGSVSIIRLCNLELNEKSLSGVKHLLTNFFVKSLFLFFMLYLSIFFIAGLYMKQVSILLISFSILFLLNIFLAQISFKSDYSDAIKINLINSVLLIVGTPVLPTLIYFHYTTSGSKFIKLRDEVLYNLVS